MDNQKPKFEVLEFPFVSTSILEYPTIQVANELNYFSSASLNETDKVSSLNFKIKYRLCFLRRPNITPLKKINNNKINTRRLILSMAEKIGRLFSE